MAKLKILFCDERYASFFGAQQNIVNLARYLDPERYECEFIVTQQGLLEAGIRRQGLKVTVMPLGSTANALGGRLRTYGLIDKLRVAWEIFHYNLRLRRFLKQEQFDLVVANGARAACYTSLACKLRRIPQFVYIQGEYFSRPTCNVVLAMSSKTMLISQALYNEFSPALRKFFRSRLKVLHTGFHFSGIDPQSVNAKSLHDQLGIDHQVKIVGLIGSVTRRKGHDLLVAAAASVVQQYPHVHFVFVGGSPHGTQEYEMQVKEQIASLGLQARCHFVEFQQNMAMVYAGCYLTVLPSRSEGLPGVVIESLAAGVPVIAAEVGGVRDITDLAGGCAVVVPPNNPDVLASQIIRLLQGGAIHSEEMMNVSQQIREHFSLDGYVGGFEAIVSECLPSFPRRVQQP